MSWDINKDKCLRCGGCVAVCPVQALELTENGVQVDEDECIDCGNCEKVCPVGAIVVKGDNE
ncbi:MAG: DUF362 domain-containing protein [Candidatus Aenigmatarchaeota archaeon]